MSSRVRLNLGLGLLLVGLLCSTGRADDATGADANTDAHLRGLELMVRPAFGGTPGDSPVRYEPSPGVRLGDPGELLEGASPYGLGFVGQGFLGYRVHETVSFGLRGGYRTTSASKLTDGSQNLARSAWDAGFYLRGYPLALSGSLRKYIDPWLAVGVAYMRDTQSFERPVATSTGASVDADWTLTHHAIAVPLGLGIDYRAHPVFSLGPSFEYTLARGVGACGKQAAKGYASTTYCSNEDPGKQFIKAHSYGVWSLGLDLKVTLF